MKKSKILRIDGNITEAIDAWISHGLPPGSCTWLLLAGDYDEAKKYAHPLILPFWDDHVEYVKRCVPDECKGMNMASWKGRVDKGEPFTCPRCKRISFHPLDVENNYCGACHVFFSEVEL